MTHICVGKLTIIGSDNGLSPGWRQAIIWTNAGILLIEPLGTYSSEILIGIQIFSFKKMRLKMSSAQWRPFCLRLNVFIPFGAEFISAEKWVSEWVIKFNGLSRTADSEVHIVHISRVIMAFTLKSLSSPT